jgi:hypothetical protein
MNPKQMSVAFNLFLQLVTLRLNRKTEIKQTDRNAKP